MLEDSASSSFPRRRASQAQRADRGVIRPIYAGVFDIDPRGYDSARRAVEAWLRGHSTVREFGSTLGVGDFDLDRLREKGLLAQFATGENGRLTVARLQHRHSTEDGYDPSRNWRTDITVEHDDSAAWIATRVWYVGIASDEQDCATPNFIKRLWAQGALSDLDILSPECRRLDVDPEADALADLILDKDRDLPVVVIADGCPLDPDRLATDSIGLAHVFKIERGVRLRLIQSLDYKFELAHGAIQTFYPRVGDEPPVAPAARFETIIGWRFRDRSGPAAFAKWLHEEMGRAVVLRLLNDPAHRTVEGVKAAAVEAQRAILNTQTQDYETVRSELALSNELRELVEALNVSLEQQMAELTERAERYLEESRSLNDSLRLEQARNHSLQQEKASLLHQLAAKNGDDAILLDGPGIERMIEQQPDQATVFDAVAQAKSLFNLYGAPVVVSETALEDAMDSPFLRPNEVLAALLRIGFFWNEIRAGSGAPITDRFRAKTGLWCSVRESKETMNQFSEERRLLHEGTEIVLEKHVTLGGGPQNAQTTAQIYFGDKDGIILIGHVGRHLRVVNTQ